jgi:hypothetical protein
MPHVAPELTPLEPRQWVKTSSPWSRNGEGPRRPRHEMFGQAEGTPGEGQRKGGRETRPIAPLIHDAESAYDATMATTKRTRNASGTGPSHSKRSNSKKTPGPKKRAAHGTSRSAAKVTPTRSTSKRGTKGTAARDPKPVARAASKTSARAASKTPARAANKAPARAANKAPARAANKAPARAASKTPARAANKAPARAANKTLARVGTRMTKNPGTGSTRKQAIVARNKGASAGGRRQSDVRRRDGTGHIDPKYAADLLAQGGTSDRDEDPSGFIAQPRSGDDLAENLAEEFVASATSGENQEEEVLDQEVPEERGGPFVESTAGAEFAWGTDASNPKDAKREPFPTT